MASKAVYDAVKAILAADAPGASVAGLPLYLPNDSRGDAPSDGSAFVAYEFPVSRSEQVTIGDPGDNTFRETGALRFVIAAERGTARDGSTGLDVALTASETLRAMFRNRQQGGLRFWEMSPPVNDDRNADGNYYRLSMAVPYWLDFSA